MELITKMLFRVHFIEYGYSHFVRLSSVRPIKLDFMHVPPQAIHCCLIGFEKTVGGGGRRSLGRQLLQGSKGWLWTDSWLPFIGECQEWIRQWLSWWTQVVTLSFTCCLWLVIMCILSFSLNPPNHYSNCVNFWSLIHCWPTNLLFAGI